MTQPPEEHIAVFCDFDGTVTKGGVLDLLYKAFADSSCWELVEGWIRGDVSTPQEMQGCFSSMNATWDEMEAVLDTVQIDPAFPRLVEFCEERGYPLSILSDGLRWYIEYVLRRYGIPALPIYANEIQFLPGGYHITTPWYHPQTPRRGVSKPRIIQKYKDEGYKTVFIGDGLSDLEAVHVADQVYARDELLEYCQEQDIPAIGFTSMDELIQMWREP